MEHLWGRYPQTMGPGLLIHRRPPAKAHGGKRAVITCLPETSQEID